MTRNYVTISFFPKKARMDKTRIQSYSPHMVHSAIEIFLSLWTKIFDIDVIPPVIVSPSPPPPGCDMYIFHMYMIFFHIRLITPLLIAIKRNRIAEEIYEDTIPGINRGTGFKVYSRRQQAIHQWGNDVTDKMYRPYMNTLDLQNLMQDMTDIARQKLHMLQWEYEIISEQTRTGRQPMRVNPSVPATNNFHIDMMHSYVFPKAYTMDGLYKMEDHEAVIDGIMMNFGKLILAIVVLRSIYRNLGQYGYSKYQTMVECTSSSSTTQCRDIYFRVIEPFLIESEFLDVRSNMYQVKLQLFHMEWMDLLQTYITEYESLYNDCEDYQLHVGYALMCGQMIARLNTMLDDTKNVIPASVKTIDWNTVD
jgi:hypothetical protein